MGFLIVFDAEAQPLSTVAVTSGWGITFDGESTFSAANEGAATEALIEGGPRGLRGPQGWSAYQVWQRQPGNESRSIEDYLTELIGSDGAPGPSGYIVFDEATQSYPDRPLTGQPVTFVGPVSPDDLGVMIDGDVWIPNPPTGTQLGLDDLWAVEIVDPVPGQTLVYDGERWRNYGNALLVIEAGAEVPADLPAGVVVIQKDA